MQHTLSISNWLQTLESEYLDSFIRDSGSSIKFAVTDSDNLLYNACREVADKCRHRGYMVIELDSAKARFHMPQDIFFGMANQVDWRALARRLILRLAEECGYRTNGIVASSSNNIFQDIAECNNVEWQFVLSELRPHIENAVFKNMNMVKDFRVAMSQLCMKENVGSDGEYDGTPVIDWLTGVNQRIGNVKALGIASGINRTTARYFIESALYWFQHVGHTGTIVVLNSTRVTVARNPRDGFRYYTRAMAMDYYELLRELVDQTDRLVGTLVLVATSEEFLDDTAAGRGFGIYPALMTRVMDDVRDRNLVNPVASLVRLST